MKVKQELSAIEKLHFADNETLKNLLGEQDKNIHLIEKLEPVKLTARGNTVSVSGDVIAVDLVKNLLLQIYNLIQKGYPVYPSDIDYAHRILAADNTLTLEKIFLDTVFISSKKRIITPKSVAQKKYIDAIRTHDMIFGIGPAELARPIWPWPWLCPRF